MKLLSRGVFALAVFAACTALSHAQSKQALESASRLYERSGMAAQLSALTEQFGQGLALNRGKVPDELLTAIAEAARVSFAPSALREDIVQCIAQKMSAADTGEVLDWLGRDVGERITLAEERAPTTMTAENMAAFLEQQKATPPGEWRRRLIADLIASVNAVEMNAKLIETVSFGIALGMDATQPVQKRLGVAGLHARVREAIPPAQLRADLSASLPGIISFTYREVTDGDLAAYLDFTRSALGVRYNEVMFLALAEALARASVHIGDLLDATPKKRA